MSDAMDKEDGNVTEPAKGEPEVNESLCGPGCACNKPGLARGVKTIVCLVVGVAALAVVANAFLKNESSATDAMQPSFATVQLQGNSDVPSTAKSAATADAPEEAGSALWGPTLESFASLSKIAADKDAVFVLLPGKDQERTQTVTEQIEAAAKQIQSGGYRIAAFTLEKNTDDYARLAKQVPIPCVLAMAKGRGASAVSGEITEGKLLQAFVMASRPPSSCGPGGCGPLGCN